jgi:hypothetical protein
MYQDVIREVADVQDDMDSVSPVLRLCAAGANDRGRGERMDGYADLGGS